MQADALSHFSKDHVSNREDNHQVQVLGPKHFRIAAVMHYTPIADVLAERIKKASKREAEVIEGLKSIDKTAPQALTDGMARWEEEDGFIYYRGKLYVPNVKELRREVVKQCHDSVTAGHPSKNRTIELVSRYYWWP
jgi:hypothetical protein